MTTPGLPPLISSDGHLEVRPERWTTHMPAKLREKAPRTIKLPDGDGTLTFTGYRQWISLAITYDPGTLHAEEII